MPEDNVTPITGEPTQPPLVIGTPEDVTLPPPTGTPNHTASREPRLKRLLGSGEKTPPKRERPSKTRKAIPKRKGMFVAPLSSVYVTLGMALMPFDPVCANAVIKSAEQCARSLDELAYTNDAVRRVLYGLIQTSAIGAVIIAHGPILLAVMVHHVPAIQSMLGEAGQQMADNIAEQLKANAEATGDGGDNGTD